LNKNGEKYFFRSKAQTPPYEIHKHIVILPKRKDVKLSSLVKSSLSLKSIKTLIYQGFCRCNRIAASTCLEAIKKMPPEASGPLAADFPFIQHLNKFYDKIPNRFRTVQRLQHISMLQH
jgi:hypothetical protein